MMGTRIGFLGGSVSLEYSNLELAKFPVIPGHEYTFKYDVEEAPLAKNRAIVFLDFPGANIVGKEVKLSSFKDSKSTVFCYIPQETGTALVKFTAPNNVSEVRVSFALWSKSVKGNVKIKTQCNLVEQGGSSRRNVFDQAIKGETVRLPVTRKSLSTTFDCEPKERFDLAGYIFGPKNRPKCLIVWLDFIDPETGLHIRAQNIPYSSSQNRNYIYLDGGGVFKLPIVCPDVCTQLVVSFETWSVEVHESFEILQTIRLSPIIRRPKKLFLNDDRTKKSVILYGDVDLNLVDGSGVWLTSVATALSRQENFDVYLLLKRALIDSPFASLLAALPNVHLLDGTVLEDMTPLERVQNAHERILQLDSDLGGANRIITRGMKLNYKLAKYARLHGRIMPYLTDIPQTHDNMDSVSRGQLNLIYRRAAKILVQSTWKLDFLSREFPSHAHKMALLPPMLPDDLAYTGVVVKGVQDTTVRVIEPTPGRLSIVYAGKMASDWGILELFDTLGTLNERGLNVELHVMGNKISKCEIDPYYHRKVFKRLSTDPNIVWHKSLKREVILKSLSNFDVGWCWRNPEFEINNKELSTKLLEYGISNLPTILTGTDRYRVWLGSEYKCLADGPDTLADVTYAALTDKKIRKDAIRILNQIAQSHKISHVATEHISPILVDIADPQKQKTILFAGHDFKFIGDVEAAFIKAGYRVIRDIWRGHSTHDPLQSHYLLEQADIVFCEWALGNLNWYADHISDDQSLFTRLHAQELHRAAPDPVNWNRVDGVIFVSARYKKQAKEVFGLPDKKCIVIGNVVNAEWFAEMETFNPTKRLGLLGVVPKLKRLDLALDILEKLLEADPEFTLSVKGKLPSDYNWVRSNADENSYYLAQMRRLAQYPELGRHVVFEPHGHDVPVWASSLDYILSTSDRESFHLAICEAGAVGAQPVILPWKGSDKIYPKSWIAKDVEDAAKKILKYTKQKEMTVTKRRRNVAAKIRKDFGVETTCKRIVDFIESRI